VHNLFQGILLHNSSSDPLLKFVFLSRETSIDLVYDMFEEYVSWYFSFVVLEITVVCLVCFVLLYISAYLSV